MNARTASSSLIDLSNLPALPQTLIELIEACNDGDRDIYSVGALVARDATISARILQLANSAFLGTKAAFTEIEQAVIYLGIDTVRNLAVSVSVHEAFSSEKASRGMSMPRFWYHSLLTAILAKTLAEEAGYASPAEAYLAGLLHDLGKLLLTAAFPEKYPQLLSEHQDPEQLIEAEQRHLGIHHAEVSGLLVQHWNLQETVAEAIRHHHAKPRADQHLTLTGILHLANALSRTAPGNQDYAAYTCRKPLDAAALERCCVSANERVEDIARAMGISVVRDNEAAGAAKNEAAARQLQGTVGTVTALFGALDNLLKAGTQDRICQVMEETVQILFDIRHCFLLLPAESSGRSRIALSSANPLLPKIADIPLPADEAASIIHQCRTGSVLCHASHSAEGSTVHPEDSRLMAFLGCEALLAVPVPVTDSEKGVLVAGLSQRKLQKLLPAFDSLRILAAHCGARLQLEQIKRKRTADLARKELAAVEKIALSIAHEISNPLAIIQNFLIALERKIAKGRDTTHDIRLISDEIERISTIARQLENITDFTSQKPAKTSRLDHLLKDILVFFRESVFCNQNIEISIKLQADTRSLPVPADTMRQVLTILFNNAVEAIGDGGKITISSTLEQSASSNPDELMLKITVSDSGPGVDPDLAGVIFDAGITTKQQGHLGLGLSIARKLLLDRDGNISYQNSPGRGSSFSIYLPVDR